MTTKVFKIITPLPEYKFTHPHVIQGVHVSLSLVAENVSLATYLAKTSVIVF